MLSQTTKPAGEPKQLSQPMAESSVDRFSIGVWLLTAATGAAVLVIADIAFNALILGSAAITAAQLLSVPAPSGQRLYLGIGVASAIPLLAADSASVAAIYAFGMVGSGSFSPSVVRRVSYSAHISSLRRLDWLPMASRFISY